VPGEGEDLNDFLSAGGSAEEVMNTELRSGHE
jgi:hypothetical protein